MNINLSRCMWGAVSKTAGDCPHDASVLACRLEVVDSPAMKSGVVCYAVCADHAESPAMREYELRDLEDLDELRQENPGRVWVAQAAA